MALICVVSALVFPLVFLLDMKPADRQLIASVSIGIITMASLSIMFWPKVVAVYEGNDMQWIKKRSDCSNNSNNSSVAERSSHEKSHTPFFKSKYTLHSAIIPEDDEPTPIKEDSSPSPLQPGEELSKSGDGKRINEFPTLETVDSNDTVKRF
jgi:hypothetical protein